jgi:hypothetical protein
MDCGGIYVVDEKTGGLDMIHHKGFTAPFVESASHYDANSPSTKLVMDGKAIYSRHTSLSVMLLQKD